MNLRRRKTRDLIYGAPIGKPVSNRCHVTLVYEHDDKHTQEFTRIVNGSSAEYRIDGKVIGYNQALEAINIFIRAKNFLVFQGAMENIVMKTPRERTYLFEEISKSGELKESYELAKTEMLKAEEDAQFNYHKRRVHIRVKVCFGATYFLKRVEKLNDSIQQTQLQVQEQQQLYSITEEEVKNAKCQLEKLTLEVEQITNQLNEANVDTSESSRLLKKQELVENLKRISTGTIYGRLVDLCQPAHKRYLLAVTKVIGKYMNAIVVDTEKTARECIQYMKEQRVEPETFLPLDYIDVKPISEKLRQLKEPRNVKLVVDVLQYDPPPIKRALQFVCGNALVCETTEEARRLAFSNTPRYKVGSFNLIKMEYAPTEGDSLACHYFTVM
ncbi:unnamed protein product [Soboliphyme baturini]|uniref:SMC hinge domain-containing protein n=1 Tax=Soboliphyme baturini TaxID=241478 RepID=A0A183ILW8_9BILA|nr:unnamed protein product [Soboliphyme baturini]